MKITQLKQGSLNGLRRQTNECIDSAYRKGYEDGKKEPREVTNVEDTNEYQIGYKVAHEECKNLLYTEKEMKEIVDATAYIEYTKGYNKAINDYNAMYEWLHDCFVDFKKFLIEKGFYTDEKFLDGFVVGQLMYDLICDHDIAEVISEFQKWQKKNAKEEIKVGDIIYSETTKSKAIISAVEAQGGWNCINEAGRIFWIDVEKHTYWKKVGHIDEVSQLLDKLRGE